ncbi:MAG TPA: hypothetical protein VE999_00965 [Gemmataceae bacterium]|jgi:hypothetical protein|nr:hypothetical protein [Gemmataceae bacterium]
MDQRNKGPGAADTAAGVKLNRAQRRAYNATTRSRQERFSLREFHEASGGVFSVEVISYASALALFACAVSGDVEARYKLVALQDYLKRVVRRPPPLCFDCDFEFSAGRQPTAFVLSRPFAGPPELSLVSGLCARCAATTDMNAMILRRMRQVWPDATMQTEIGGVQ